MNHESKEINDHNIEDLKDDEDDTLYVIIIIRTEQDFCFELFYLSKRYNITVSYF